MDMANTPLSYFVGELIKERGLSQVRQELLEELVCMSLPEAEDRVEMHTSTTLVVVSRK